MDITSHIKKMAAISLAVFALPLMSRITNLGGPILCPPIGLLGDYWLELVLLVGVVATALLPAFALGRASRKWVSVSVATCVMWSLFYGWSLLHYGRSIDIPNRQIHDFVVVGTERSDFAETYFSDSSDADMLESRGWSEQDLQKYWTKWSLEKSRVLVLIGFMGTILSVNLLFSIVVLPEAGT